MRALAILGMAAVDGDGSTLPRLDGVPVNCGIVDVGEPRFDSAAARFAHLVLVKVSAFSCNYRDRSLILDGLARNRAGAFFTIGSEFCGRVVGVGSAVSGVAPGDRVVGRNDYSGLPEDRALDGVPTNSASEEYLVLHERKVARIPDSMPDSVGAAFSLGAQTAYSMIRKLDPRPGETALVTSATANTSLFLIAALRRRGVRVVATTGSTDLAGRVLEWGVERLVHRAAPGEPDPVVPLAREMGGFHHVFDPFFDSNLQRAVGYLRPHGKYTTCGLFGQSPSTAPVGSATPLDAHGIMLQALVKNLSIIGNCLGRADDLQAALDDFARGDLDVPIDSVHGETDASAFLTRTYVDRRRFGKVVFEYAQERPPVTAATTIAAATPLPPALLPAH